MENEEKTFEEANSACQDKGGFLVEPRSAELNTALAAFTWETSHLWIGAKRLDSPESSFTWLTDNESITYTNWDSGQPNNYRGNQKCLSIKQNYRWDDAPCTMVNDYICQARKRE